MTANPDLVQAVDSIERFLLSWSTGLTPELMGLEVAVELSDVAGTYIVLLRLNSALASLAAMVCRAQPLIDIAAEQQHPEHADDTMRVMRTCLAQIRRECLGDEAQAR
jgi:hypothetical protein